MIFMGTNEDKPNCKYFNSFAETGIGENNGSVGYFSGAVLCDNYDCVNCGPKFDSVEFGCEIAFCNNKGCIENGIPVDGDGNKLESDLSEDDLARGKTLAKIKPHNPKTDKPYTED